MSQSIRWRFVYPSTGIGMVVPLIHCYECGSVISDQAMACPKCGAPKRNEWSFEVRKFPKWFHLISYSLFGLGIILLTISGFSDAWFADDYENMESKIGLTHMAIDCSEVNDEDDKMVCKIAADILFSGQTQEDYANHAGLDDDADFEEYAENLPEKQSILIGDLCNSALLLEGEDSDGPDRCREMETAGFAGVGLGIASILTGVVGLILILLNLLHFENEENISTANSLAILSTIMAIIGFFAWIILLPDDMFEDSDTGWAFGLAIASLSIMTVSILMMITEKVVAKISKPNFGY